MIVFVSDAKKSNGKQLGAKRVQKEQNMEPFYLARPCASDAVKKTEETLMNTLARPCHIKHGRASLKELGIANLAKLIGTTVP